MQEQEQPVTSPAEDAGDPLSFSVSWCNAEGKEENGPLTLLWHLVESYKVDIFEVSLARITTDFLDFLKRLGELRIEVASSFTVMASRLLYYKSKSLLPDPGFEEADQDVRLPPELIQQMLEYRKFQQAAEKLAIIQDAAQGMFVRKTGLTTEIADDEPWLEVSLVDLVRAYASVLERIGETEKEAGLEMVEDDFPVEEKITYIRALLASGAVSCEFEDLFGDFTKLSKGEVIATFLALLELAKAGEILLRQKAIFGTIHIFRRDTAVT